MEYLPLERGKHVKQRDKKILVPTSSVKAASSAPTQRKQNKKRQLPTTRVSPSASAFGRWHQLQRRSSSHPAQLHMCTAGQTPTSHTSRPATRPVRASVTVVDGRWCVGRALFKRASVYSLGSRPDAFTSAHLPTYLPTKPNRRAPSCCLAASANNTRPRELPPS